MLLPNPNNRGGRLILTIEFFSTIEEQLNTILEENNLRSLPPPATLPYQNKTLISNQDALISYQDNLLLIQSHLEEKCIKSSNHYRQQSSHLLELLYKPKRSQKAYQ